MDCLLSILQHAASDRPYLRRLPLRQLRHPHQTGRRVERRMRTLPRPGQRTRRTSFASQHPQSLADGQYRRERHLYCLPLPRTASLSTNRRQGVRLARRLPRWSSSGGLLETRRSHLGQTAFTHFADGTAHKNRMQGNDFVRSVMYRKGITCSSCHDVHGTENYAQLRKPANRICLDCHSTTSPNGPHVATMEQHTYNKDGSPARLCVACHMPKIESEGVTGSSGSAHTFKFIAPTMTGKIPDTECLYFMPQGQDDCVGDGCDESLVTAITKVRLLDLDAFDL